MQRVWLMAAVLCLTAAAVFLWRAQADESYWTAVFVAATLGAVAWFMRLRAQLREILPPPATLSNEDTADEDEHRDEK